MEYNKESFKKALKECEIIRWENHFENVVKAYLKAEAEQLTIPVVRDSLNFGFCKYPQDVCDTQCQDCKAEEMWGNKNLH